MSEEVISKRAVSANRLIGHAGVGAHYESPKDQLLKYMLDYLVHHTSSAISSTVLLHELEYILGHTGAKKWVDIRSMLEELEKRALGYSYTPEKTEAVAYVFRKKKADAETERKWPSYAIQDFESISKNLMGLENAGDDRSQILYYIMEIETLLAKVEKKAGVTNRRYEARLAASLRDICRVHEPSDISKEQIECFKGCVNALIEGWGELNREKVRWIRSNLLGVGLTWLPVTDKSAKDISKSQNIIE